MQFYNIRRVNNNYCEHAVWTTNLAAAQKAKEGYLKRGAEVTLDMINISEFKGTPALNSFTHWEYSPEIYTFSLCLDTNKFPVCSRGILAEISAKSKITFSFTALASCGLFGTTVGDIEESKVVESLDEAVAAIELGIRVRMQQIQNQINSLLKSAPSVTI